MPLKLKLGQIVALDARGEESFMRAFRRLRALPLPAREAYALALCAGVVDTQHAAYHAARTAVIKQLGKPLTVPGAECQVSGEKPDPSHLTPRTPQSGWAIDPADEPALKKFWQELQPLSERLVELPLEQKVKLPPEAVLCADDVLALLEIVEL